MLAIFCLLLSVTVVVAQPPPVHEKPIDVTIRNGGKLELKVPSSVNIWHREFADGRKEYVEFPNQYLDVSNVWRSGTLGSKHSPIKVEIAKDGTLRMPKVTAADSAQYYTYYTGKDFRPHYSYFNVKIGK
ncbi:hypothetical protein PENTCL1PPCAC_7760 [Pristionchus entomophagus]|uniref:Uncharacterized protein n=1 Tax=Pristionchus entomophagus TaxID=358040 RepID=A0AAV5SSF4_9BILA|nr:hypothetical protein PENTCL1PPCAC_7760 [Pristionchus entomophagus]